MVCANDGTANEAYCYESDEGFVCARAENGGMCEAGSSYSDYGDAEGVLKQRMETALTFDTGFGLV